MAEVITRETFLNYDPSPIRRGSEERYLCCFDGCGDGKPKDDKHRCLCLNTRDEIYICKRCTRKGRLGNNYNTSKPKVATLEELAALREEERKRKAEYSKNLNTVRPLLKTDGALYLEKERLISPDFAAACGVKYSANFYGGNAVLFPMRDMNRKLVAINARYIRQGRRVEHRTVGDKDFGVFSTPGAWDREDVIITEAPIDAISLAQMGLPAVAICGGGYPNLLYLLCAGKRVVMATDNDGPGNLYATSLASLLKAAMIDCVRVKPRAEKDWNRVLTKHGKDALQLELIEAFELTQQL